jgi:hypothetical protein
MKLSMLVGGAAGYVLGARAGRVRYEQIVAIGRRVAGSQTVQTTAGVLQAQVDGLTSRARQTVAAKLHAAVPTPPSHAVNGHSARG